MARHDRCEAHQRLIVLLPSNMAWPHPRRWPPHAAASLCALNRRSVTSRMLSQADRALREASRSHIGAPPPAPISPPATPAPRRLSPAQNVQGNTRLTNPANISFGQYLQRPI